MEGVPDTDQELSEYQDVGYTEPPKSVALYVDATKWIVGLATGSFFLTGPILTSRPATAPVQLVAGVAIVLMAVAIGCGVRALQCFTRVANLIEVNAVRKPLEIAERSDGYQNVRWATKERVERCKNIAKWLKSANNAYTGMTGTFALGVGVYLLYIALYLIFGTSDGTSAVKFSANAAAGSPILGIVHDGASKSDCVVVRSNSGLECRSIVAVH
jgi:hypothetical protein